MRRWIGSSIVLPAVLISACGQDAGPIKKDPMSATVKPVAGNTPDPERWGPREVAALFLNPEQANLDGGEVRTIAAKTTRDLFVCTPLNPFETPTVTVGKRYATAGSEIGVPYKGRIVQQGWVMPSEAAATAVMKKVSRKVPECRYSGSAPSVLQPGTRLSGVSVPHVYPRDEYGWSGYRIEQTLSTNNRRASVNTRLLIQRGSVVLALEYVNYTRKTHERLLRKYNMSILNKILRQSV